MIADWPLKYIDDEGSKLEPLLEVENLSSRSSRSRRFFGCCNTRGSVGVLTFELRYLAGKFETIKKSGEQFLFHFALAQHEGTENGTLHDDSRAAKELN